MQGKLLPVATEARQHPFQGLLEEQAVGQIGQAVMKGEVLDLLLGLLARRDVDMCADHTHRALLFVLEHIGACQDVDPVAVPVPHRVLHLELVTTALPVGIE